MTGLAGDDIYYVNNAGDVVTEAVAGGYDQVVSTINYTLPDNVENLYLSGSALNGTGNAENNFLSGTSANNSLSGAGGNDVMDGYTGNDTMSGGTGDDVFYVDSSSDVVNEASGEGTDWVYSSATTYTLTANVENLYVYSGTTGIGNGDANLIQGNSAANTLNGAGGNDTIYGYEGNDSIDGGTGDDLIGGTGDDYCSSFRCGCGKRRHREGTDHVVSTAVSYTISDSDVETLWMYGSTSGVTYYGYGNSAGNIIEGNSSAFVANYSPAMKATMRCTAGAAMTLSTVVPATTTWWAVPTTTPTSWTAFRMPSSKPPPTVRIVSIARSHTRCPITSKT